MSELSLDRKGGAAGDTVYTEANLTNSIFTIDFPTGLCWQDIKTFLAVVIDNNGSTQKLWLLYKDEDVLKGTNDKNTSAYTVCTPQATDTQISTEIFGLYCLSIVLKAVFVA